MRKNRKIRRDELGFLIKLKKIRVKEIVPKERQPVRLKSRSTRYAEKMKGGEQFPPIQVFGKRFRGDTFQVFNGHARVQAHKLLGREKILAEITIVDKKGRTVRWTRKGESRSRK